MDLKDCSAASALLDVQCLQSSAGAFAALCSGGRVVAWGSADYGGLGPATELKTAELGMERKTSWRKTWGFDDGFSGRNMGIRP